MIDEENQTDLHLLGHETVLPERGIRRNTIFAVVNEDEHALGVERTADEHIIVVVVLGNVLEGFRGVKLEPLDGFFSLFRLLRLFSLLLDTCNQALDVV